MARSIAVMPGDKINTEVYAKYIDTNSSNWTTALNTLLTQIAAGTTTGGTVIDGGNYTSSTTSFPFSEEALANTEDSEEAGPKAYLNWLVFDKNYVLLDGGYDRLSTAPSEHGQDVDHERLYSPEIQITEPGFVYIYLSNEEEINNVEVYFDDFKVTHTKSPVIQSDDYYPFGLTFNSYNRENSVANQYKYNGKELQDELNLGWMDYGWRMYQPDLGRFFTQDPHADSYSSWNPYNYVADNPVLLIDPDGRDWEINKTVDEKTGKTNYAITFTAAIVNQSENVSVEDLFNLAFSLMDQIESAFKIDEDNVSTSVTAKIRFAEDGKTNDNEHVFRITDDLPSDVLGDADLGGRDIRINSSSVSMMNSREKGNNHDQHGNDRDERDKTTGPHEAGHTAGLTHPDERTKWYSPSTWFLPSEQYIEPGQQKNNLMYSGPYRTGVLKQDLSNGGKGYKINANQARIMYENRDNK